MKHAPRKIESRLITTDSASFYFRAARITKPKHFRDLVERFACGVIDGSSHDPVIRDSMHVDQQGVSTANNQRNIRLDRAVGPTGVTAPGYNAAEKWREQVTFKVIDGKVGFAEAKGETLGE